VVIQVGNVPPPILAVPDVRAVRRTATMLVKSDVAREVAIESLRKRLERAERKVGIAQ
jgi:hypothetical protein